MFSQEVVAAELFGPPPGGVLSDSEARACATFGTKRIADFTAGRACARHVLERFGFANFSLLAGSDRRPCWPAGVIGSISHTEGYCGVVASTSLELQSLGFDAERTGRITEELWPTLFTSSERARLAPLGPTACDTAATILFSAKEAFYKCRSGVRAEWLDFTDAEVTIDEAGMGTFRIRLIREGDDHDRYDRGRYAIHGDFVLTGIAFTAASTT